jgi:hypothetical protein
MNTSLQKILSENTNYLGPSGLHRKLTVKNDKEALPINVSNKITFIENNY